VKISKPEAYLKRDGKILMKFDSALPLIISDNSKNSPISLQLRMHTLEEEEAALAIAHIQAETFLSSYEITYSATLNVRVIALPIYYKFKGTTALDDVMDPQNNDDAENDDAEKQQKASEIECLVNASCWFTSFEDECCHQDGNLTEIRFLAMQDEAEAFNMQSEAVITSPLIRVSVPAISAQVYIHNKSAAVPSEAAMHFFIKEPALSESGGQRSAMRGEVAIRSALISSLKDIVSLGNSDEEDGGGNLRITTKMAGTEETSQCQLQRLVSKLEIEVDPSSTPSQENSTIRSSWLPDGVVTDEYTSLDFAFKSYKELSESTVSVTLAMNNLMAFPVRIKTGTYALKVFAPPFGTAISQHSLHPAIQIKV